VDLTLFQKPQVNLARSSLVRMRLVSICAFMAIFQSSLSDNWRSLIIALAAIAGTMGTELLFNMKDRSYSVKDGSALASALILALFLPNTLNPLYAFSGGVFAMAVIKHSFGGLGSNWINPAAGAWLFIRTAWPEAFNRCMASGQLTRLSASVEGGLRDSMGQPLTLLKINGWPAQSLETGLHSFFNDRIFSFAGTTLPQGYLNFLSFPSGETGIIADRGVAFLILGVILIASAQAFRFWLPITFLALYTFLIRAFGALPFGGPFWEGDILFALFSGGTLAGAFLLITDPATGPKSTPGYLFFTLFTALMTFIFRYWGLDPYSVVSSVLLGNALVPLINRIENALYYEKRRDRER
jgi:electron transport complex protein RnfD